MKKELLNFFTLLRGIFGICPRSGEIFRLSECKIYLKQKPNRDWLDKIESNQRRLDSLEDRINEAEDQLRAKAREEGRRLANQIINKLDCIFKPLKLNPDDSKVIFHPVDYIVFNGMKNNCNGRAVEDLIRSITFLDRQAKEESHKIIQKSIEKVIKQGKYDWQTLRVLDSGEIKIEN